MILTEQQRSMLPLANAIMRVRSVFSDAPFLQNSDSKVPGCASVTWRDLYEITQYAARKFNEDD